MSYTELKTSQATFRLLHRSEGGKSFVKDWPAKVDAVIPELVHRRPIEDLEKRFESYVVELEENPQFQTLVQGAKKEKFRICFADLAESQSLASGRDHRSILVETFAGFLAVGRLLKLLPSKSKSKRLKFFGWTLSLFWFLSSVAEVLGMVLARTAGNTAKKGPLRAIQETIAQASLIHPEKKVVFWRNLVIAEKVWELVSLMSKKDHRPTIVLDFHFGHAGLLKMIGFRPEIRQTMLRLYRPLVKDILIDPARRDYLNRLMIIYFGEQKWQLERTFLAKSLKEL